jgi:hypothetical protein
MAKKRILTWLRPFPGSPPPPTATPFGCAALQLKCEGIDIIIAASPSSWMRIENNTWKVIEPTIVDAVYDRYSSRSLPENYSAMTAQVGDRPRGNPADLHRICMDKIATQRVLHDLPMPAISINPSEFQDQLETWRQGFLKARFGGLGRGVFPVVPGNKLPCWGPGAVRGGSEPTFLQQAIQAPKGFGSLCVRWLTQRNTNGSWHLLPPVARVSQNAVSNIHQGAAAFPADEVLPLQALKEGASLVRTTANRLTQHCPGPVLELGIDLLFDTHFKPWLLEVNSRPNGRLSALTAKNPTRFAALAEQAVLRPLRSLAALT